MFLGILGLEFALHQCIEDMSDYGSKMLCVSSEKHDITFPHTRLDD